MTTNKSVVCVIVLASYTDVLLMTMPLKKKKKTLTIGHSSSFCRLANSGHRILPLPIKLVKIPETSPTYQIRRFQARNLEPTICS